MFVIEKFLKMIMKKDKNDWQIVKYPPSVAKKAWFYTFKNCTIDNNNNFRGHYYCQHF